MRFIYAARGKDLLTHKLLMVMSFRGALGRGVLYLTDLFTSEILCLRLGFMMCEVMLQRLMKLRVDRRFVIFLKVIKFGWTVMLWRVGVKMGLNCFSDFLELLFIRCRCTMYRVMINQIS
jgi:hypothetical protein